MRGLGRAARAASRELARAGADAKNRALLAMEQAIRANADAILVTADSVNMASEAAATGAPVHVFWPGGGHPRLHEGDGKNQRAAGTAQGAS